MIKRKQIILLSFVVPSSAVVFGDAVVGATVTDLRQRKASVEFRDLLLPPAPIGQIGLKFFG
jgi:hypothetical protein